MYSKTREIIKTFMTSTTRPAARVGAIHINNSHHVWFSLFVCCLFIVFFAITSAVMNKVEYINKNKVQR